MDDSLEWLESDGQGGFASGTVFGIRTRRYHALLLTATTPPVGRMVLVNGFDAWLETTTGRYAITLQQYPDDSIDPSHCQLESFSPEPWPTWIYCLADGTRFQHEVYVARGGTTISAEPITVVRWKLLESVKKAALILRPFFTCRDYHATHRENADFRFEPEVRDGRVIWRPYNGVPAIQLQSNGNYQHEPHWYRNFSYSRERERGLDCTEDLASPGLFRWELADEEAVWMLSAGETFLPSSKMRTHELALQKSEKARRAKFLTPLHRAADAYIVRRGEGKTIIAGYPWFTDWGRDTFIALRGLCLSTGRCKDAEQILLDWSNHISEGMLPNRFPDDDGVPEYNSVDASLWFVVAVHSLFESSKRFRYRVTIRNRKRLEQSILAIIDGYAKGTRYGIRLDEDGLIAAGVSGMQLTWMDAKVGDHVVTPRIGKPVEVQALWLNALWIAGQFSEEWNSVLKRGRETFETKFYNESSGGLYDVIDCDHEVGKVDGSCRPNQILAIGGLPLQLVSGDRANSIVNLVEARLWTSRGLRSLCADDPRYVPYYDGDAWHRDRAYHQGTVWPWLAGPFIEAWVRVQGNTMEVQREARERFVLPLLASLNEGGLGHMSEIADAESPHHLKGCPFQAWSLGELLRVMYSTLESESP